MWRHISRNKEANYSKFRMLAPMTPLNTCTEFIMIDVYLDMAFGILGFWTPLPLPLQQVRTQKAVTNRHVLRFSKGRFLPLKVCLIKVSN